MIALLEALIVALAALILAPGYLFYFDLTPKVIVLLTGTALTLVIAAVSGVSLPAAKPRRATWFSLLLALYVASLAVATAASPRPDLSLFGTSWRWFGGVIQAVICLFAWLIALGCAGWPRRVVTVLRGVTAAGAISAVYGIAQYLGWDPFLSASRYHFGSGIGTTVRPPGTLGHGNYFATWLLWVIFLSLALRAMETSAVARRLSAGCALLAGCAMLLTGTRAGVVGLAAGGAVWAAMQGARHARRVLVFAGVAALAVASFCLAPPGRQLRARARCLVQDPWGSDRLLLWRDSLRMASDRPITGHGPEMFTAGFARFESQQLAQGDPALQTSANNMLLDTLVAQGLPSMLLLAALCVSGFLTAVRLKQPAFAGALAAGIVSQQFTPVTLPNAMILWATLGLLVALDSPPAEPLRRMPRVAGAAVAAALLLYAAGRVAVADHALALAKQRLDAGDLPRAEEQYRRYERVRLPGASADEWYSQALLAVASHSSNPQIRLSAVSEGVAAADRATESTDDPFDAWYNRAMFCGNPACAEQSLREAIAASPMWFKPHWALAELLRVRGDMAGAEREAARAAELDAGRDPEVRRTVQEIRAQTAEADPRSGE